MIRASVVLPARRLLRPRVHLHQRRLLFNFPGPLSGSDGKPSLFLNMVMAMPLCGAWYYFRVNIMEDWMAEARQKKEAGKESNKAERTAEIMEGAEAVVAVAAAAKLADDAVAATAAAAAAAAAVPRGEEVVKSSKNRGWAFWR